MRRPSPSTGIACWKPRSRTGSSPRWSARPSCAVTSPASISPSTARCWRRGRHIRASSPKMVPACRRHRRAATSKLSSTARGAATRPTAPPPIPKPGWPAVRRHPARLCYAGHLLMENRNALIVYAELTQADGMPSGPPPSSCSAGFPDAAAADRRCRQGLRHEGVRRRLPGPQRDRACRPAHQPTPLSDRRADDPARQPPGQSTYPTQDRGALRLDQDHRRRTQAPLQGQEATGPGTRSPSPPTTFSGSPLWTPTPRKRAVRQALSVSPDPKHRTPPRPPSTPTPAEHNHRPENPFFRILLKPAKGRNPDGLRQ